MIRGLSWSVTGAAALVLVLGTGGPASAQDGELKRELEKLVEGGASKAGEEIGKLLKEKGQGFADEVLKIVEKRLSKLEADLKARDQKIAELEAKIKSLAAPTTPVPPPAPAAPSSTFLGVGHLDVPADLRSKLKIDGGALITQVLEDSPAAKAGLAANDVLVDVQGTAVTSANLSALVAGLKPDQEVNLTYFRDGNRITKAAKLADREKYFASRAAKAQPPQPKKEPVVLGVVVAEKDGGLVAESVEEGFTGSVAGLKAGDKLTHLNGKELKTIEDIQGELKKAVDGDKLVFAFSRGDEKLTASVVGAAGKGGAKLLASESSKKPEKPKEEPKPAPDRKPAFLGVAVVETVDGLSVDSVVADSAAAAAGLKKGDLLRKLNGKDLGNIDALRSALGGVRAGDKVSLGLTREGKAVDVKDLELKAEGEKVAAAAPPAPKEEPKPAARKKGVLGIIATQTVTNQIVVKTLTPGGAGEKAELKPGDVILKANDTPVTTFDDLAKVLGPLFAGDTVSLRIKRGNDEKDLKLVLGEA